MRENRGFTLIEILIVAAAVGVIAAIAIPTYQSYVVRSNRADIQQVMQQISQQLEAYKANNGFNYGYLNPTTNTYSFPSFASTISTTIVSSTTVVNSQYPSSNPLYTLTLALADASGNTPLVSPAVGVSWILLATPTLTGAQRNNGILVLNDQGWTCWNNPNGTAANLCSNSQPTSTSTWSGN